MNDEEAVQEKDSLLTVTDYCQLAPGFPSRRYRYGPHPSQFADLFLPAAAGPSPLVLLVHGGCWQAAYGLEPLGQLAAALAARGVAVWSIEYRRIGEGGGWPQTLQDVAAASDFLPTVAADHRLDLQRVVAVGHSAGGQLALWLAGRRQLAAGTPLFQPAPLAVQGVLSLAGIPDLRHAAERQVCGDAVAQLLGGDAASVADRYAAASPAALTPLGVPHVHIHGQQDTLVPLDLVAAYVEQAQAQGDPARLTVLPAAGHFDLVAAHTPAGMHVVDELLRQVFLPV